ncbi:MAG: hypothetical protein QOF57_78 [Frankiaceae bacterium]|jgi:EmrB/QacA subfamily drug resistance transporter|nr:hypothetical protein [Frankiaceae bacterium]
MPAAAILSVCCTAQFMVVLDVSVVDVALPDMRHSLGLSVTGQQWVVNAYTLTFAGFLMLGGRAADLFGRRRVFMTGLLVFTLASLVGGLARNGEWLVGARAVQGVGGAILAPTSLSLLTTSFPERHRRMRALRVWSATASSAAAVGVVAGGLLTHFLDWRWVLFINMPIGSALLWAAWSLLDESRTGGPRRTLDIAGAFTVTGGLAVVVFGIVSTATHPWGSPRTLLTLTSGVVLLATFVVIEARIASDPIVPLATFRRRSVSIANAVAIAVGCALFGMYFFLSLFLQQINGYSALAGGLAFLPSGLASLTTSLCLNRLPRFLRPRRQLVLGPVITAGSLFWLAALAPGDAYLANVFGPLVLFGLGLGLTFVPMTAAATDAMPAHQAGLASALVNTSRQVGGAVGLAVMATVAAAAANTAVPTAGGRANGLAAGYDHAFAIPAVALLVAAGLALFLPTAPRVPATEQTPVTTVRGLEGEDVVRLRA